MTRLSLFSRSLLVLAGLALVVGIVALPTDAFACTCVDDTYSPWFSIKCGSGGQVWCQICTFCY